MDNIREEEKVIYATAMPGKPELADVGGAEHQNRKKTNTVVFEASTKEKITAWLFLLLGFVYSSSLDKVGTDFLAWIGVFTVLFIVVTEMFFWEHKRSFESIVFLVCLVIVSISFCFDIGSVWQDMTRFFFLLRLRAAWLIVVLSFACVCVLISMFSGKKTAKVWFMGSAVTLSVLTLI